MGAAGPLATRADPHTATAVLSAHRLAQGSSALFSEGDEADETVSRRLLGQLAVGGGTELSVFEAPGPTFTAAQHERDEQTAAEHYADEENGQIYT